ncbi:MAG TPA: MFS transporter [Candidatus Acidoferrales bacterium]|nr:MFS transporter [Candidatus Acidoferrales bacterium]
MPEGEVTAALLPAAEPKTGWSMPPMFRSLAFRNFRLFFAGQLISLVGTWMQTIAQSWLVYRLTGSSLLLGTVAFASQIPVFVLAPAGGIFADRFSRHRIVITTQTAMMLQAGAFAWLTLSGRIRVWEIVVLSVLLGVANAFDIPARQAFLIEMVDRETLMNAIALNSSMFNAARVAGPAVAGILVAAIGEGWCFFANAISYIAVIVGLLLMRLEKRYERQQTGSPVENVVEGFRFARSTAPVWALLLLVGLVSLVAMPYTVLMPIFADRVLHGGARGLGLLMGATGIGALAGALALAARTGVYGLGRWVAISAVGFGVSLAMFAFSPWFWVSFGILVPVGFTMMLEMACTNTLLQAMSPDRLRGRVMALYSMMFMGLAPLGSLFAGGVADRIGAPWTVAVGGIACIAGALAFAKRIPTLRGEARRLIVAQGLAGGEPADGISTTRSVG